MDDVPIQPINDGHLVAELSRLGIRHLSGVDEDERFPSMSPVHLLCGMVLSQDARVQMALVPLFLHCPGYSVYVPVAVAWLSKMGLPRQAFDAPVADTLQLYYQAAVYIQISLQQGQSLEGQPLDGQPLADLYSAELGLTPAAQIHTAQDAELALQAVAEIHTRRAGSKMINWVKTYQQQLAVYQWYASPQRVTSPQRDASSKT